MRVCVCDSVETCCIRSVADVEEMCVFGSLNTRSSVMYACAPQDRFVSSINFQNVCGI